MRDLGVRPLAANDVNHPRALTLAVERLRPSHYYDVMLHAVNDVASLSAELKSRITDQIWQ